MQQTKLTPNDVPCYTIRDPFTGAYIILEKLIVNEIREARKIQ